MPIPTGLFLSHIRTPRVLDHFDRLVTETEGIVEWRFVLNTGNTARPDLASPYPDPADVLPLRYAATERNGGVQGGFLDVALIPCVLAQPTSHVWIVEYDVDYSGDWATFFRAFEAESADVLTSTITSFEQTPGWTWWTSAAAPSWVPPESRLRAFHPVLRLSRMFARTYASMMADSRWAGHYEFTIPTAAKAAGMRIVDIGPGHYDNTPEHPYLSPGTFVWRPSRAHYFHEHPDDFEQPDRLHHPVKPNVVDWAAEHLAAQAGYLDTLS